MLSFPNSIVFNHKSNGSMITDIHVVYITAKRKLRDLTQLYEVPDKFLLKRIF